MPFSQAPASPPPPESGAPGPSPWWWGITPGTLVAGTLGELPAGTATVVLSTKEQSVSPPLGLGQAHDTLCHWNGVGLMLPIPKFDVRRPWKAPPIGPVPVGKLVQASEGRAPGRELAQHHGLGREDPGLLPQVGEPCYTTGNRQPFSAWSLGSHPPPAPALPTLIHVGITLGPWRRVYGPSHHPLTEPGKRLAGVPR